jgi:predicted DNA-binding ribbon-helix-helix protein
MKRSSNIKVTISISQKFYSQLQKQAEAVDLTVNTLLKQSALSAFNKTDVAFLTSEQRIIIKDFTLNQIKLSQQLQQISQKFDTDGKNAFPLEQLLEYMKQYHELFVKLIEDLKASE